METMTKTDKPKLGKWAASPFVWGAIKGGPPGIDENKGILKSVAIVTVGEAQGHGVQLDQAFVQRAFELAEESTQGLKVRFGHPNMSSTALGTFIGRAKDFFLDGDTLRGNIYLSRSIAEDTPHGNLFNYIMRMAATEPDMFGTSIVFRPGEVIDADPENPGIVDLQGEGLPIATIEKFLAVDIVDDPAANPDGIFSQFDMQTMASQATEFLDLHPEVFEEFAKQPEVVEAFIARYTETLGRKQQEDSTMLEPTNTEQTDALEADVEDAAAEEVAEDAVSDAPEAVEDTEETVTDEVEDDEDEDAEADAEDVHDDEELESGVAEFRQFNDEFGSNAGEYFAANLTIDQARVEFAKSMREDNEALQAEVEKLKAGADAADGVEPIAMGDPSEGSVEPVKLDTSGANRLSENALALAAETKEQLDNL